MDLIVEDGSGLPNANSYVAVETADAYHTALGNSGWAGTVELKETALRKATQYIDMQYGASFTGQIKTIGQQLLWPRSGVFVNSVQQTWPVFQLTNAVCEVALRAMNGTELFVDVSDSQKASVTVGPITTSYKSMGQGGQTRFTVVDRIIAPLLLGASRTTNNIRLERA